MATSGAFETNNVGNVYPSPPRLRFEWSRSNYSEDGNWTQIYWKIMAWGGQGGGYWVYNFGTRVWVDGAQVGNRGTVQQTNGMLLAEGHRTLYHNGSGSRSFGASADGRILNNAVTTSGSGSWSLNSLYQEIGFDSIQTQSVTDTSFKVYVDVNRTANLLQLSINGGGWVTYYSGDYNTRTVTVSGLNPGTRYTYKVRVRRKSNNNLTESGTYGVNVDAATIQSFPITKVTDTEFTATLNTSGTVDNVGYSLNGGAWTSSAKTVSFDNLLSDTNYTIRMRVRRVENNTYYYTDTVTVRTLNQNKFFDIGDY